MMKLREFLGQLDFLYAEGGDDNPTIMVRDRANLSTVDYIERGSNRDDPILIVLKPLDDKEVEE